MDKQGDSSPCCEEDMGDAQWTKLYYVSSLLSLSGINTMTETNWMRTGFISIYTSRSQGIAEVVRAGTEAEIMGECCIRALPASSLVQDPLPGVDRPSYVNQKS